MIVVQDHSEASPHIVKSLPEALALVRSYFMTGGRTPCSILYDGLAMAIEIKPDWDMKQLP